MGYTILDILDKLIQVEINIKNVYLEVAKITKFRRVNIVARILSKDKERHIEYYKEIREENSFELEEDIPFDIYDKISFLVNQFKTRIRIENFNTLDELLDYALDYEEMNKALLIDMQGRLLRKKEDNNTVAYKVLLEIIRERQKHINNIQNFIKPKNK